MGIFRRIFGKREKLSISTGQIKDMIYNCLSEGLSPEQVLVDRKLAGWELLKSRQEALLYIKYINRRMKL